MNHTCLYSQPQSVTALCTPHCWTINERFQTLFAEDAAANTITTPLLENISVFSSRGTFGVFRETRG